MNCTVDIVERLRSSQTAYGWINRQNEEAAKEIERLRAALSPEAQPEVTGAVADCVFVSDYYGDAVLGKFDANENLYFMPDGDGYTKDQLSEFDAQFFFSPSAIEAAVREKLEESARIVENSALPDAYSEGCLPCIADEIRALMESPHPSVEEPAN